MIGCYIIFSEKLNRFYIGATQEGMENRLAAHNSAKYGKSHFTSHTNDWTLFLFIPTSDFAKAIRIERKIKSMKSVNYIYNLKKYPEMVDKLVSST